jgi:hypothetical protein
LLAIGIEHFLDAHRHPSQNGGHLAGIIGSGLGSTLCADMRIRDYKTKLFAAARLPTVCVPLSSVDGVA